MDQLLTSLNTASSLSAGVIVTNLALAIILSLVISYVYQKTHKGLSYSQSLAFTLVFLTVVVAIAMMVIGNNLVRAFGFLGAFSIIRFRTAIKDTKDIAYVFFALVVGMSVGTGSYLLALLGTLVVCILLFILNATNFGSIKRFDHMVTFTIDTEKANNNVYQSVFDKFLKNSSLINVSAGKGGKKMDFTFNVAFKDEDKAGEFSKELGAVLGVSEVNLLTSKHDIEY